MKRLTFLALLLSLAFQHACNKTNEVKKEQPKQQQEAETVNLGGAKSGGALDIEDDREDKMNHSDQKQKQLYEYEGHYRRGF